MDARNLAHAKPIDVTTPVPVLNNIHPKELPSKLTAYFVITKNPSSGEPIALKMTLRKDDAELFGTLEVRLAIKGDAIEFYNAAYTSKVRGCSAYAIRHFLRIFSGIPNVSFITNDIYSQDVAGAFEAMGFDIVERTTNRAIDLASLQKGMRLKDTVAKLDFKKAPVKKLVFRRLWPKQPAVRQKAEPVRKRPKSERNPKAG